MKNSPSPLTCLAVGCLIPLLGCGPGSPDLTPQHAGEVISRTREFNQSRTLVAVSATRRGTDSLKECCYTATFSLKEAALDGTSPAMKAEAEFRYWEGDWHLQNFGYLSKAGMEFVQVESDVPHEESERR